MKETILRENVVKRGPTGEYKTIKTGDETFRVFIPFPLPPKPPLEIVPKLRELHDQALLSLGRLDSVTTLLLDTDLFLYMYVRREAVLSSQIEGTQSTLSDLLLFELKEAPGVPLDDVREVSHYVVAMEYGLKRMTNGFPLSNRLLREIHETLLGKGSRGKEKQPGEFRKTQNWIQGTKLGNALFVAPLAEYVQPLMSDLEKYIHDRPEKTPVLIKAALAHLQFETIHPFLDGNGRIGRMLITLILCNEKVLREPLLYLSLYLKQHRTHYFDLLMRVRNEGDWEAWLEFFFAGIREMADGAVTTAMNLSKIAEEDRSQIHLLKRKAGSALRIHQSLQKRPLASIHSLAKETKLTVPTVTAAISALQKIGIVKEITGRRRNRFFSYRKYMDILMRGTEV